MAVPVAADLLNHIHQRRELLVQATQALVQAASPNPPGDVSRAARTAATLIAEAIPSSIVTTHETAPGVVNIVAIVQGNALGKRLVFSGHLDTYPFGDESTWTASPTSGALSADAKRIYGRGSADMKGGIAASIVACAALAELKDSWNGEVVIALAGDEQTIGPMGSGFLVNHVEAVRCDAAICPGVGSPMVMGIGEKGLIWVEISATGQAAHGAHVHKGINAIDRLLVAVQELKELESFPVTFPQGVDEILTSARPVSEAINGAGEDEVLRRVTVNVGEIRGGVLTNLTPDTASASADIRIPLGVSTEQVIQELSSALGALRGVSFQVKRRVEPSWTSPTQDIVRFSLDAARTVVNPEAVVNMQIGASDSRLFRSRGIPTVVVGLTPYNLGGPDEHIMTDELVQVAGTQALSAWRFLQAAKDP